MDSSVIFRSNAASFGKVRPRQRTWLADGVWADMVKLLEEQGESTPVLGHDTTPALVIRTDLDVEALR